MERKIISSYFLFGRENKQHIFREMNGQLNTYDRKYFFRRIYSNREKELIHSLKIIVMKSLDQLFITSSVRHFLWSNYDPRTKKPSSGVLLAGKDKETFYSTLAVKSPDAFDLLSPANEQHLVRRYLSIHPQEVCVVPWFQYNSKYYSSDFSSFCERYVCDPFLGIIVLKPTAEEGKRNFNVALVSRQIEYPLHTIYPQHVPFAAQKNISNLIQYWVSSHRFQKNCLYIVEQ